MPGKQAKRDTAKYRARDGRKTVKAGITDRALKTRESEIKRQTGDEIKLTQVGRRTTREAALKWERQQRDELTHRKQQ